MKGAAKRTNKLGADLLDIKDKLDVLVSEMLLLRTDVSSRSKRELTLLREFHQHLKKSSVELRSALDRLAVLSHAISKRERKK